MPLTAPTVTVLAEEPPRAGGDAPVAALAEWILFERPRPEFLPCSASLPVRMRLRKGALLSPPGRDAQ